MPVLFCFRFDATIITMIGDFEHELRGLCNDLHALTGYTILWKDADHPLRLALPRELVEHRHPYCLAVKEQQPASRRCLAHDLLPASHWSANDPEAIDICTCHAGVCELRAPVFDHALYLGTLFVGAARKPEAHALPGLSRAWQQLPRMTDQDEARMRRTAHLARRALRLMASARSLELFGQTPADPDDPVRTVLMQLHRDARADHRISDLARQVHLSPSRLVHAIKERTGEPFRVLRERAVMRRAARLLIGCDAPISAIAARLGFASPAYFSTAFKRATGRSPAQLRTEHDHA